jgi:hypothetical protein
MKQLLKDVISAVRGASIQSSLLSEKSLPSIYSNCEELSASQLTQVCGGLPHGSWDPSAPSTSLAG